MSFAAPLRCPIPHDLVKGAEVAALVRDTTASMRDLLAGTAGTSPFLAGLIKAEAAWLAPALHLDPDRTLAEELARIATCAPDRLGPGLRQAKRRVALLTALADLAGIWPLEAATGALTGLADASLAAGLRALTAEEIRRGKLPGARPEEAEDAAGMVILAMGKMGAHELNYSSDIDLICLYDETRYPGAQDEARASFVRVTRKLMALLSDQTDQGYVFRTDLRLRPDAAVTPVCLSMAAAEHYYESVGRTWERAAYIKARSAAGAIPAGERFLRTLVPFVWRRHLDFAAIQDAHDMRLRIRDHRGLHGPITLEQHNMKLGQGGIREIEFFTQTRQLIAGGRDASLRARGTLPALAALAQRGWVQASTAEELSHLYRAHREVEHRLQMLADAQTHDLPATPEGFDRLARFMGEGDTAAFRRALLNRLTATAALTESFFAPAEAPRAPDLTEPARQIVEGWRAYPALRSARAVEIFKRLRPRLLQALQASANPESALLQFDAFLKGLPAGVQVFSLFESNPQLVDLIIDIIGTVPRLAHYLARHSGVLDAVIGGSFFAPFPGEEGLRAELAARLEDVADYEARLDAARRWAREWHFRTGVHHLRGLIDGAEAAAQYSALAGAVVAALWPVVQVGFALRHGVLPGAEAVVLGMGSLGAQQLNAASDLDLIVVYDPGRAELSDGPRPLAARPYFARLTQALVTALGAPMAAGRLYEVDMRLRPSGRQGPVATSFEAFQSYQRDEAWTWEHLALTRARVVAGPEALAGRVEALRRDILGEKGRNAAHVQREAAKMRARVQAAKPATGPLDVKALPGGLMDIDLVAQLAALLSASPARGVRDQLAAGLATGWISGDQYRDLLDCHALCWQIQGAARLLGEQALDLATIGPGALAFVLRETSRETMLETGAADPASLQAAVARRTAAAARVVRDLMGDDDGA